MPPHPSRCGAVPPGAYTWRSAQPHAARQVDKSCLQTLHSYLGHTAPTGGTLAVTSTGRPVKKEAILSEVHLCDSSRRIIKLTRKQSRPPAPVGWPPRARSGGPRPPASARGPGRRCTPPPGRRRAGAESATRRRRRGSRARWAAPALRANRASPRQASPPIRRRHASPHPPQPFVLREGAGDAQGGGTTAHSRGGLSDGVFNSFDPSVPLIS
eukprot:1185686-Prorocentrum_minimum.AAC.1